MYAASALTAFSGNVKHGIPVVSNCFLSFIA